MPGTDANNNSTPGILAMPPAEDIAVQAISALITDGYTSSVMKLSRPVLNELGRRLIKPGETVNDAAVEWLEAEGHTLKRSSIYRFAQRFREVYKRTWGSWANKLIVTRMAADPDFDVAQLQDLIKNRVTTIVAQEVMTSDPSELKTDRLFAHLSLIAAADKGRLERDKLELATRQAEDRAAKLEAEVGRIKQDQARKDNQIEERLKALRLRIDELSKRAQRGQSIDPSVFAKIRDELMGVAE